MKRLPSRPIARATVALLGAVTLTGAAFGSSATASPGLTSEYVALGDSFAAGPLILPQVALDPCFRSGVDYPAKVAETLGVSTFRDVTCSSATTANVLDTPQPTTIPGGPAVPVQLDAVTRSTTLVTLTIGANDIGLAQLALTCFNVAPPPLGVSCKATSTAGGVDTGAAKVDSAAPLIARTLDAIHAKAPRARILVTSYTNYIQKDGCYPLQPVWADDANYIQGLVDRLGAVTRRTAAAHHAEYVDLIGPAAGHDGCRLTQNWANVIVPGTTLGIVPLHPTALGERNFARLIVAHLQG